MVDTFFTTKQTVPLYCAEDVPSISLDNSRILFPTYTDIERNYKENKNKITSI